MIELCQWSKADIYASYATNMTHYFACGIYRNGSVFCQICTLSFDFQICSDILFLPMWWISQFLCLFCDFGAKHAVYDYTMQAIFQQYFCVVAVYLTNGLKFVKDQWMRVMLVAHANQVSSTRKNPHIRNIRAKL